MKASDIRYHDIGTYVQVRPGTSVLLQISGEAGVHIYYGDYVVQEASHILGYSNLPWVSQEKVNGIALAFSLIPGTSPSLGILREEMKLSGDEYAQLYDLWGKVMEGHLVLPN